MFKYAKNKNSGKALQWYERLLLQETSINKQGTKRICKYSYISDLNEYSRKALQQCYYNKKS